MHWPPTSTRARLGELLRGRTAPEASGAGAPSLRQDGQGSLREVRPARTPETDALRAPAPDAAAAPNLAAERRAGSAQSMQAGATRPPRSGPPSPVLGPQPCASSVTLLVDDVEVTFDLVTAPRRASSTRPGSWRRQSDPTSTALPPHLRGRSAPAPRRHSPAQPQPPRLPSPSTRSSTLAGEPAGEAPGPAESAPLWLPAETIAGECSAAGGPPQGAAPTPFQGAAPTQVPELLLRSAASAQRHRRAALSVRAQPIPPPGPPSHGAAPAASSAHPAQARPRDPSSPRGPGRADVVGTASPPGAGTGAHRTVAAASSSASTPGAPPPSSPPKPAPGPVSATRQTATPPRVQTPPASPPGRAARRQFHFALGAVDAALHRLRRADDGEVGAARDARDALAAAWRAHAAYFFAAWPTMPRAGLARHELEDDALRAVDAWRNLLATAVDLGDRSFAGQPPRRDVALQPRPTAAHGPTQLVLAVGAVRLDLPPPPLLAALRHAARRAPSIAVSLQAFDDACEPWRHRRLSDDAGA